MSRKLILIKTMHLRGIEPQSKFDLHAPKTILLFFMLSLDHFTLTLEWRFSRARASVNYASSRR